MNNAKKSGSYYTPQLLAEFMVYHVFKYYKFEKKIRILEPSAGDGHFFKAFFNNGTFRDRKDFTIPPSLKIDVVEKDMSAMEICKSTNIKYLKPSIQINYFNQDYLDYSQDKKRKFDLVIGNPPYIKKDHLTKRQIQICEDIHKHSNLSSKKIKNIWTSFLIAGAESLNDEGILCLVLPAEILQVIYAKEIRNYLKLNFKRIEIFAFNQLVFEGIEQDVIILVAAKQGEPGVSFYQVKNLQDLAKPTYVTENSNIHRESLDKWTNYVLSDEELRFLDSFRDKLKPVKHYCQAGAGIVTAANNYFIINKELKNQFFLNKAVLPILQKGTLMPSALRLTKKDHTKYSKENKPMFLLALENKKESSFSKGIQKYLAKGRDLKLNERYKCKLRDNWYCIPSIWKSEGFFTKRSNLFPKIVINEADIYVTDSFYRIKMKDKRKIKDLAFSFCNTLTLIFAELEGRYYGGTVLELMPNEFKNLRIPYCENISPKDVSRLDKLMRSKKSLTEILNFTDKIILKDFLKMSDADIKKLRTIYFILVKRRFKNNKANI